MLTYKHKSATVFEFNPDANESQIVHAKNGRIPMHQFNHNWFTSRGQRVACKINAGFFNTSDLKNTHIGLVCTDGGFEEGWPTSAYECWLDKSNIMHVENIRDHPDNRGSIRGRFKWAITLGYSLVLNGKKDIRGQTGFPTGKTWRTLWGQKADKTIVLVIADNIDANESADLMLELGCVRAISADGGGSSQMEIDGQVIRETTRPLGTMLLVFAKPGEKVAKVQKKSSNEIVKDFIPVGRKNRPGLAMTPRFITIHDTGNTGTGADAKAHATYLNHPNTGVSWHYTTDSNQIIQHLPTNENGWHAGDGYSGTGNRQSIGIEKCINRDGDFNATVQITQWLVANLMKEHNIPIENVVQHNRWSGKNCPQTLRSQQNGWTNFIKGVIEKYNELFSTSKPDLYRVRVAGKQIGAYREQQSIVNEVIKALNSNEKLIEIEKV
ncbi:hypothetical protein BHU72_12075 [Desulfuribacillus stibiiarsenatis]|uniref:N-acetylmuramoyl-L-alanine amidase n=1 Tax=Desulfuribacillus stibiiarsenatis TaxID=1390249 RepID=A0A1E5L7Z2_9FIRM|nr:N-acetylmuramoyl-L-alanine amidase [Desulfuribacillus stibiiarsenatis]OEH86265.1 hypothetical protein BHU72_12075 [Desulfuribacillus stibiiarsenatis]